LQVNRLVAADAMQSADNLAQQGKLDDAKTALDDAVKKINSSKTGKETFSTNLVNDISSVKTKLNSRNDYNLYGSKELKMNVKAHHMQRAVQSTAFQSQQQYANVSKTSMKAKAQKK